MKAAVDVVAHNRRAWDRQVDRDNQWTRPVSKEAVAAAREGSWDIVLTPQRPVPKSWLPVQGKDVLCLASGGGQQGPLLAAAGARVTVFDNAPAQLARDREVADRDGLALACVLGDMAALSVSSTARFDQVINPCSVSFVESVLPVWREAHRVLRPGGELLVGMTQPHAFLFDETKKAAGILDVRHKIPYADTSQLTKGELAALAAEDEPYCFGHSLSDLVGGQLTAGFSLIDLYEDRWGPRGDDPLDEFISCFLATRARKA